MLQIGIDALHNLLFLNDFFAKMASPSPPAIGGKRLKSLEILKY